MNDHSGKSPLLSYLVVVVIAHLGTITVALKEGGIGLLALLFYGAIPFFIPGFFVGIACLLGAVAFPKKPIHPLKILLGIFVIALPFYEWHLLATLPRGYLGR